MKFTIIHVNNRAQQQMDHNIEILSEFEYVTDISFFNAHVGNADDVFNHKGISQETWAPYDGRAFEILPGEKGIWLSTIASLEYAARLTEPLLVLEDDVTLVEDFPERLKEYSAQLPPNFDFLSLYYFAGHNWLDENSDCGLKGIHKSINQFSGAQAIMYSPVGAKRILRLIQQFGIEYTSDCFIFNKAQKGILNGYSIKPDEPPMLTHDYIQVSSLIDPDNKRLVEM